MYLGGIWIKGISEILIAILAFLCGLFAYKKLNWKSIELSSAILVCLVVMVFGFINISHAINPNIQQVTANYVYQSKTGVVFGREYHFVDKDDNYYDLTMDPITYNKLLDGVDFNENILYTISYETKSNTIVDIAVNTGDGS